MTGDQRGGTHGGTLVWSRFQRRKNTATTKIMTKRGTKKKRKTVPLWLVGWGLPCICICMERAGLRRHERRHHAGTVSSSTLVRVSATDNGLYGLGDSTKSNFATRRGTNPPPLRTCPTNTVPSADTCLPILGPRTVTAGGLSKLVGHSVGPNGDLRRPHWGSIEHYHSLPYNAKPYWQLEWNTQ